MTKMDMVKILFLLVIVLVLLVIILLCKIISIRRKHKDISQILDEIKAGNSNRKIISSGKITDDIGYKINDIVEDYSTKLIKLEKSDISYKKLMTSLSHDVRTPLTSLIGYLDAIQSKVVDEEEKDQYIEIARNKAYNLKNLIDMLFEWVKLDSKEREFHFENIDINEFTRDIIIDWIPIFEKNAVSFNVDILETEYNVYLDVVAYTRIINNIIQNSLQHGECSEIGIKIIQKDSTIIINIYDNGRGIDEKEIPYVFERLYKCDESRSNKGSGLGLSIVKELVNAHHGSIYVTSILNKKTTFTITLPINMSTAAQ